MAGTLGGVAMGGGIDLVRSYALERQRQRADKRSTVRRSLLTLLNSIDDLQAEMADIPRLGRRHERAQSAFAAALPNASFALNRVFQRIAQPNLPAILARTHDAMNRVLLDLPDELLRPMTPVAELLRDWRPADTQWSEQWSTSVNALRIEARRFLAQ